MRDVCHKVPPDGFEATELCDITHDDDAEALRTSADGQRDSVEDSTATGVIDGHALLLTGFECPVHDSMEISIANDNHKRLPDRAGGAGAENPHGGVIDPDHISFGVDNDDAIV